MRSASLSAIALSVIALLATTAVTLRASPSALGGGSQTKSVLVHPAPGSVLEFDDAEVVSVYNSITSIVRQNPSCLDGKVGDALDAAYPHKVSESVFPPDYVMHWNGEGWDHICVHLTEFVVDFGTRHTVLVEVSASELKN